MRAWLALCRPGDWLLLALGLLACGVSLPALWQGGLAERAVIWAGGERFAETDLRQRRQIDVPGPLGLTRIAIEPGRARVLSDPGPRQYCVHQGWLMRPGDIAICAPNQVSLQILGRTRAYDALSY